MKMKFVLCKLVFVSRHALSRAGVLVNVYES